MIWKTTILLTVLATATLTAASPLYRRAEKSGNSTADPSAAGTSDAGSSDAGGSDVSSIDISKLSGDPKANAQKVCPAGATDNKAKGALGERMEKEFFNPEIAKASGAQLKALECQKIRNKALKNSCQFEDAKTKGQDALRAKNEKQVTKNVAGATKKCEGVDTSLFKTPTLSGSGGGKEATSGGKKGKKDKKEKKSKKKDGSTDESEDGGSKKKDKKNKKKDGADGSKSEGEDAGSKKKEKKSKKKGGDDASTASTGTTESTESTGTTGTTESTGTTSSTASTESTGATPVASGGPDN